MSEGPGLLRIRVPLPIEAPDHINLYLLPLSDEEYCLIDAGWGDREGVEAIKHGLEERGLDISQVSTLIITHLHRDHAGGAALLRELTGARVYLDRKEYEDARRLVGWLPRLEAWLREEGAGDELVKDLSVVKGWIEFYSTLRFDGFIDGEWELGLRGGRCRVFSTPGHSAGHLVALLTETGELIGGDLILPHETSNVPYHPWSPSNSLLSYLSSLDHIRRLGPKTVYPSHGDPIHDPVARIDELFRHHGERLRETLSALDAGPLTAIEVARNISWSIGRYEDLSPFNKWLALLETLSHLVMLEHSLLVSRVEGRRFSTLWAQRLR